MFYLLALLVLVIGFGVVARSYRGIPDSSLAKTAVRVGGLVSVVRLGAFFGGFALYSNHSDWRQTVGYALLIVNSVAELAIAAAFTGNRSSSPVLVAGLIVLTSAALGWTWAWLRVRSVFR